MPPLVHELASESEVSSEDGSSNVSEINCYNSRKLVSTAPSCGRTCNDESSRGFVGNTGSEHLGKKTIE